MEDIFASAVRSASDLAGVFEFDGEASYFYLWQTDPVKGRNIVGAVPICSGTPNFASSDVLIVWDSAEKNVGLFIKGSLWAVFSDTGKKFGGRYSLERRSSIPEPIRASFGAS